MQIVLKTISTYIIYVKQLQNQKQVLFHNDRYCRFSFDEEFQKLWRSGPVEGLDEQKIGEYLNKQGITSMEAARKCLPCLKGRKPSRSLSASRNTATI